MNLTDRIRAIREAGMVERAHCVPHNRSYNNGFHTWGVCCLIRLLWPESPHLVDFALFHDVPERWTGDTPGQIIRSTPALAAALKEQDEQIMSALELPSEHALDDVDFARFKGADRLEFWLWTFEEEAMGNLMVLNARTEAEFGIEADPHTPPEIYALMDKFRGEGWRRHRESF